MVGEVTAHFDRNDCHLAGMKHEGRSLDEREGLADIHAVNHVVELGSSATRCRPARDCLAIYSRASRSLIMLGFARALSSRVPQLDLVV